MNEMVDNTFYKDFTIADAFGVKAIQDTYNRAFKEWSNNYEMLTALVITLNHKIWEHYKLQPEYAKLYDRLWAEADNYALDNLKDEALQYFLEMTE